MLKIYLFIFGLFIAPSLAYLDVYIPQCAKKIITKQINYTLSNFGSIPYGESYIGQVFKPKVLQNKQLCTIQNQKVIKSQNSKTFLLVKRGSCKFTQKVLNAQKLGADMVIIYDNQTTERPHIIMKNDGHGHLITIPSIFISGKEGQQILKVFQQCNQNLFLKQVFDVFESEIADLSLWLNLNNRQSYVLLRDFYKYDYYEVIDQYVNIQVKFKVDQGCQAFFCDDSDCVGNDKNQYCFPFDKSGQPNNQLTGGQILKESLRMYLLFYLLPDNKQDVWFKYMDYFDENICLQAKDIETCSYETMNEIGVSKDLVEAIKSNASLTLKKLDKKDYDQENIFYWVSKESNEKSIIFYPQAVINGKNFYGLFKAPQVFEMICNSLLNQPKQCYSFIKNKSSSQVIDKNDDLWLTVFFIILLMILGFLVALFVYTRLIKKEVNQQMSMQVNKMVENYVSLTEQKSGSQQDSGSYNKVTV